MPKQENEKIGKLIWLFIGIITLWITSILIFQYLFPDLDGRGLFGDSFGAINSLFSGLAFGGIIYTILLQRKELRLQREELKMTREELKRTADAQESINNFQLEQLRISNLPTFQFQSAGNRKSKFLNVRNLSGNLASDVELWIYFFINNRKNSKEDFIEKEVKQGLVKFMNPKSLFDEDIWFVSDYCFWPIIDSGIQFNIEIDYPIPNSDYFSIFLQYRDGIMNNYATEYYFEKTDREDQPYSLIQMNPPVLQVHERINLGSGLLFDSGKHLSFIGKIVEMEMASIPAKVLKNHKSSIGQVQWPLKIIKN